MINRFMSFYPSTRFILTAYALLSGAWIIGGDILLSSLADSAEQLQRWQTLKGLGFAFLGAGVLTAFAVQRDRNEAALRESETHYRTLFFGSASVMLLIDAGTGGILDANPAALGFYGYTLSEITALRISDLTSLDPEDFSRGVQLALTGEQGAWSQ